MRKQLVGLTIAAGLLAVGCGDDDTWSTPFGPTLSPTVSPTPVQPGTPVLALNSNLLLRRGDGDGLFTSASLGGTQLDFSNAVLTVTLEGEAEFVPTAGAVLSNGNKTATITLTNTDPAAIAAAFAGLRARANDSGLGIFAQSQVTLSGRASNVVTSPFYTGNVGARVIRVQTNGRVSFLENDQEIDPSGGFPAAVNFVAAITPSDSSEDENGRGSIILFDPGQFTGFGGELGNYEVGSDGDLNQLLIAGNNVFGLTSGAAPVLGTATAPRREESVLVGNWSALSEGPKALLRIDATDVTIAGIEFQVEQRGGEQSNDPRAGVWMRGSEGAVGSCRFIVTNLDSNGGFPAVNLNFFPEPNTRGVQADGNDFTAQGNLFQNFGAGIYTTFQTGFDISENAFVNNALGVFSENGGIAIAVAAVAVEPSTTNSITRNLFTTQGTNFDNPANFAVHIGGFLMSSLTVENNDFYDSFNNEDFSQGIYDFRNFGFGEGIIDPPTITQSGNYTPTGSFVYRDLSEDNFSPNDTPGTTVNFPNAVR